MIKSIMFVGKEHIQNIYRIVSIARYEIASENRDTKFGALWNFFNPLLYIATYWFVFGVGIRNNAPVDGIPYIQWMLTGLIVWFFMSNCIRSSTSAISSKLNILEKIKFPVSILPTTIVASKLVEHLVMVGITYIYLISQGHKPQISDLTIFYYIFCCIAFCTSFGLVFSVLSILVKDIKKIIPSALRMLFYVTPILWTMDNLPKIIQQLMGCNPIYYIVHGYRVSFFHGVGYTMDTSMTIVFWLITTTLFVIGCGLMRKYRHKFIDIG